MGRARAKLVRRDRCHLELVYLLPAAGTLIGAFVVAAAALIPAARAPAAAVAALALLHLGAVAVAAARALRSPAALALAPSAFVVQQASYGAGFLRGLVAP
jgi:hypothetical protein